jgi:hypothetical protein
LKTFLPDFAIEFSKEWRKFAVTIFLVELNFSFSKVLENESMKSEVPDLPSSLSSIPIYDQFLIG